MRNPRVNEEVLLTLQWSLVWKVSLTKKNMKNTRNPESALYRYSKEIRKWLPKKTTETTNITENALYKSDNIPRKF